MGAASEFIRFGKLRTPPIAFNLSEQHERFTSLSH